MVHVARDVPSRGSHHMRIPKTVNIIWMKSKLLCIENRVQSTLIHKKHTSPDNITCTFRLIKHMTRSNNIAHEIHKSDTLCSNIVSQIWHKNSKYYTIYTHVILSTCILLPHKYQKKSQPEDQKRASEEWSNVSRDVPFASSYYMDTLASVKQSWIKWDPFGWS